MFICLIWWLTLWLMLVSLRFDYLQHLENIMYKDFTHDTILRPDQLLLLECGEYSDRSNVGLFRVKKPFSFENMETIREVEFDYHDIRKERGYRVMRLSEAVQSEYLEEIEYYELNTDMIDIPAST